MGFGTSTTIAYVFCCIQVSNGRLVQQQEYGDAPHALSRRAAPPRTRSQTRPGPGTAWIGLRGSNLGNHPTDGSQNGLIS